MKIRIAAIATAAVIALSAPTLTAFAEPTTPSDAGTPVAGAPVTPAPTPEAGRAAEPAETPRQGGWPQATFKGRTATVSNLAPGWNVTISAWNLETDKEYVFRGKAKGDSVVIEMKGLPAGTYDISISAGDLPANESHYWGHKITGGTGTATKPPKTKTPKADQRGGLAKTGV